MDVPADNIRFSFRMEELRAAARGSAVNSLRKLGSQLAERDDADADKLRSILAHSGLRSDLSDEAISDLWDAGFAPEIDILMQRETVLEMQRCTALAAESDPRRRAELQQAAEAVWATPPGANSDGCWVDLRTDMTRKPTKYQGTAILLPSALLSDPAGVVAVTAHELGHEVLWGRKLIDTERPEAEAMADLYAVFQGFGIFMLNKSIELSKDNRWQVETFGYLGERGYAEALATYWLRHRELCPGQPEKPPWRKEVDWTSRLVLDGRLKLMSGRTKVS